MMNTLLSSNLVQLGMTASAGMVVYLAWRGGAKIVISAFSWFLCLGILFGAITGLGETYIYSTYYRRSFFYFGDLVPMVVNFVFLFAIITGRTGLAYLAATAAILSGGKAALLLLGVMVAVLALLHRFEQPKLWRRFASAISAGLVVYGVLIGVSALTQSAPDELLGRLAETTEDWGGASDRLRDNSSDANHRGACPTIDVCAKTQLIEPLKMRYFSALGGLWMTMQGGFRSERYPSTAEMFSELMTAANPFGINDIYGLTSNDWHRIGSVQSPYLAFGAGYGPWLLATLLIMLFGIGLLAMSNLLAGERGLSAAFSIFYLVTIVLNQTQSWINSASYGLVLVGFCATHIVIEWIRRRQILGPQSWAERTKPSSRNVDKQGR